MSVPKHPIRKILKFASEMENTLKSYVCIYVDPRNNESFCIGKGKGINRLLILTNKIRWKKSLGLPRHECPEANRK